MPIHDHAADHVVSTRANRNAILRNVEPEAAAHFRDSGKSRADHCGVEVRQIEIDIRMLRGFHGAKDRASHDSYQDDATHNKFIDEMKANWSKVRVFDSLI